MFPGVINCTSMDWFHEWPREALIDVASRKLMEVDFPSDELRDNIAANMAEVHISIAIANSDAEAAAYVQAAIKAARRAVNELLV